MTIRHKIAQIVAVATGGGKWNTSIEDDETSLLIIEKLKASVPELVWDTQDKGRSKPDLVSVPYHLTYRMDGTYGVFYLMSFIGIGVTLDDAKAIAQQWDVHLKTGWMTQ
tara:strand:+ start:362 stop:691 length:330 start_codon:yes stop_codon:yes gene_type:complete